MKKFKISCGYNIDNKVAIKEFVAECDDIGELFDNIDEVIPDVYDENMISISLKISQVVE